MITVEKVTYHDKKRTKLWNTVFANYNGIRVSGIVETNLKTNESKINWFQVAPALSPNEYELIKSKGYKEGQDILKELTEDDKQTILEAVKAGQ